MLSVLYKRNLEREVAFQLAFVDIKTYVDFQ